MKYLVDSNVFLEAALNRQHAREAVEFLTRSLASSLCVADFSLHAMGFYLTRRTPEIFDEIVSDVVARSIPVLRLEPGALSSVTRTARRFGLDFDDAFVYTVAEQHDLIIVSFDSDFDRTARGRRRPADALAAP